MHVQLSGTGVCSNRSHAPMCDESWLTLERACSRSRDVNASVSGIVFSAAARHLHTYSGAFEEARSRATTDGGSGCCDAALRPGPALCASAAARGEPLGAVGSRWERGEPLGAACAKVGLIAGLRAVDQCGGESRSSSIDLPTRWPRSSRGKAHSRAAMSDCQIRKVGAGLERRASSDCQPGDGRSTHPHAGDHAGDHAGERERPCPGSRAA